MTSKTRPGMKLAFSTLGCPSWEMEEIARAAASYGYEGIELRALGGSLNLLERPEFQPSVIKRTRAFLTDHNLSVCCVDTSCSFDAIEQKTRCENIETAARYGELAEALGAPLIRVFPNEIPEGATREETRDRIAASLCEAAQRMPDGVCVGLETHGDFARGSTAAEIVRLADHPKLTIIWDAANSFAAGDTIAESARAVHPFLTHVHLRDARPSNEVHPWRPVLAGCGLVPLAEVVRLLQEANYDGYLSFEWEKYWHPEIEGPETALPDFAAAMRQIFRECMKEAGGRE